MARSSDKQYCICGPIDGRAIFGNLGYTRLVQYFSFSSQQVPFGYVQGGRLFYSMLQVNCLPFLHYPEKLFQIHQSDAFVIFQHLKLTYIYFKKNLTEQCWLRYERKRGQNNKNVLPPFVTWKINLAFIQRICTSLYQRSNKMQSGSILSLYNAIQLQYEVCIKIFIKVAIVLGKKKKENIAKSSHLCSPCINYLSYSHSWMKNTIARDIVT